LTTLGESNLEVSNCWVITFSHGARFSRLHSWTRYHWGSPRRGKKGRTILWEELSTRKKPYLVAILFDPCIGSILNL